MDTGEIEQATPGGMWTKLMAARSFLRGSWENVFSVGEYLIWDKDGVDDVMAEVDNAPPVLHGETELCRFSREMLPLKKHRFLSRGEGRQKRCSCLAAKE